MMSDDAQPDNAGTKKDEQTASKSDESGASMTDAKQTNADELSQDAGAGATTRAAAYVDPEIAAEAKIAELEAKVSEMRDRYLRAYADTENLRKRTEREKADISKYAVTSFARDMLSIADNLGRAVEAASGAEDTESGSLKALLDGVMLTQQELKKTLEKHGVRTIASEAEAFDPHKHQAVMEREDASVSAGTIVQVFQDGYQIEERVLRPAMVVVAKGGAKPIKSSQSTQPVSKASDDGRDQDDQDERPAQDSTADSDTVSGTDSEADSKASA
ncbi:MAG: nucleotide exchange factor GrpE [Hyphomicrobiaceae bacterium]